MIQASIKDFICLLLDNSERDIPSPRVNARDRRNLDRCDNAPVFMISYSKQATIRSPKPLCMYVVSSQKNRLAETVLLTLTSYIFID